MRLTTSFAIAFGLAAAATTACGSKTILFSNGQGGAGGQGQGGSGGATSTTTSTGGTSNVTTTTVGPGGFGGEGGSCTPRDVTLAPEHGPVDAIFVADNTFQSNNTLSQLELQLYPAFVNTMDQLGLDIQVIMLANHGATANEICIPPPLSQTTNCSAAPQGVAGRFQHYSVDIQFGDALCKILDSVVGNIPDEFNSVSGGWQTWLRNGALKAIVPFAQYGAQCTWNGTPFQDFNQPQQGQQVATSWDAALLGLAPQHFGSSGARNYVMHSFVGIAPKPGDAPYLPSEPIELMTCFSQVGTGYQWLSKGTASTRFSVCSHQAYGTMLAELAFQIAEQAEDPCNYTLPNPPPQLAEVDVSYTPTNGTPQTLLAVPNAQMCMPSAYYWEGGNELHLCPQACNTILSQGGSISAQTICLPPE